MGAGRFDGNADLASTENTQIDHVYGYVVYLLAAI
jgi:hypothetical protein